MNRIRIVLLAVLCSLIPFYLSAQAHPNHHPGGDCNWGCTGSCLDAIKDAEEGMGDGACTNWTNTGAVEGTCRSDHPGPQSWEVACDSNGCSAWGKMRCAHSGGVNFPVFSINCDSIGGLLPMITVTSTYTSCLNEDGVLLTIACSDNGNLVTSITYGN